MPYEILEYPSDVTKSQVWFHCSSNMRNKGTVTLFLSHMTPNDLESSAYYMENCRSVGGVISILADTSDRKPILYTTDDNVLS
jgi:hypothetical protein